MHELGLWERRAAAFTLPIAAEEYSFRVVVGQLHLNPRIRRQPGATHEAVLILPVEIPVVDLQQRDAVTVEQNRTTLRLPADAMCVRDDPRCVFG